MPKSDAAIKALVNSTEIVDIRFHEVSAKRTDAPTDADDSLSMQIMVREDASEIGVRCQARVSGGGGEYYTDAEGVFALSEPIEVSPETLQEFIERVGVMVVYPYVREAITDGAARLALPRPVMKILRPGDLHLSETGTPTPT